MLCAELSKFYVKLGGFDTNWYKVGVTRANLRTWVIYTHITYIITHTHIYIHIITSTNVTDVYLFWLLKSPCLYHIGPPPGRPRKIESVLGFFGSCWLISGMGDLPISLHQIKTWTLKIAERESSNPPEGMTLYVFVRHFMILYAPFIH